MYTGPHMHHGQDQVPPAVLQPDFRKAPAQTCVTMFLYQKSLKIQTTDKVIRVHTEKALSC